MKNFSFEEPQDSLWLCLPGIELDKYNSSVRKRGLILDIPSWIIEGVEREADKMGIPSQALIKVWLAYCLKKAV